jgi:hypothetical protein
VIQEFQLNEIVAEKAKEFVGQHEGYTLARVDRK